MGPGGTRRLDTIFNLGLLSEDSIMEPNIGTERCGWPTASESATEGPPAFALVILFGIIFSSFRHYSRILSRAGRNHSYGSKCSLARRRRRDTVPVARLIVLRKLGSSKSPSLKVQKEPSTTSKCRIEEQHDGCNHSDSDQNTRTVEPYAFHAITMPNVQLTDGGPPTPELPNGAAGPPFGGAPSSAARLREK